MKFDAVPTENGPYCNEPKLEPTADSEQSLITPEDIEIDQLTCIEKQANYSVKYGDFLTNSEMELMNVKSLIVDPLNTAKPETPNIDKPYDGFQEIRKIGSFSNTTNRSFSRRKEKKFSEPKKVKVLSPLKPSLPLTNNNNKSDKSNDKFIEIEISPEVDNKPLHTSNELPLADKKRNNKIKIISEKSISDPVKVQGKLEPVPPTLVLRARNKRKDPNPPIEKQPIDISSNVVTDNGIFTLFSPNTTAMSVPVINHPMLEPPQTYETNIIAGVNENVIQTMPYFLEPQDFQKNTEVYVQVLPVSVANASNEQVSSFVPVDISKFQSKPISVQSTPKKKILNLPCKISPTKQLQNTNKPIELSSPSKTVLKNKIPPERVAAIEEKRKFNKKLRDMIEFCLDELDDPDKKSEGCPKKIADIDKVVKMPEKGQNNKHNNPADIQQIKTESTLNVKHKEKLQQQNTVTRARFVQNKSLLQKGSTNQTLTPADSYISILENRLQKMEDLLLQKIDQNSQNIAELKKSFCSPTVGKKSTLTQTSDDEEAYKKQLYQEMSKYLTPNVNSLVYEELFLNKFSQRKSFEDPDLETSLPKRRRRLR